MGEDLDLDFDIYEKRKVKIYNDLFLKKIKSDVSKKISKDILNFIKVKYVGRNSQDTIIQSYKIFIKAYLSSKEITDIDYTDNFLKDYFNYLPNLTIQRILIPDYEKFSNQKFPILSNEILLREIFYLFDFFSIEKSKSLVPHILKLYVKYKIKSSSSAGFIPALIYISTEKKYKKKQLGIIFDVTEVTIRKKINSLKKIIQDSDLRELHDLLIRKPLRNYKILEKLRRQNESREQKEARLKKDREYSKRKREEATPEQRKKRQIKSREYYLKKRRKNEIPEQRELRKKKDREFNKKKENETPKPRKLRLKKISNLNSKSILENMNLFQWYKVEELKKNLQIDEFNDSRLLILKLKQLIKKGIVEFKEEESTSFWKKIKRTKKKKKEKQEVPTYLPIGEHKRFTVEEIYDCKMKNVKLEDIIEIFQMKIAKISNRVNIVELYTLERDLTPYLKDDSKLRTLGSNTIIIRLTRTLENRKQEISFLIIAFPSMVVYMGNSNGIRFLKKKFNGILKKISGDTYKIRVVFEPKFLLWMFIRIRRNDPDIAPNVSILNITDTTTVRVTDRISEFGDRITVSGSKNITNSLVILQCILFGYQIITSKYRINFSGWNPAFIIHENRKIIFKTDKFFREFKKIEQFVIGLYIINKMIQIYTDWVYSTKRKFLTNDDKKLISEDSKKKFNKLVTYHRLDELYEMI